MCKEQDRHRRPEGTSTTYSPADGPACETTYEFRVRAYGNGATYVAGRSAESEPESVTTGPCNSDPEFDPDSYTFSVSKDASTGDTVGTVSATDPDEDDTVSYSITVGNGNEKFMIDSTTGEITVNAALDYETTDEYGLTVEACRTRVQEIARDGKLQIGRFHSSIEEKRMAC